MLHRRRYRALSLAVLALGFSGAAPALAAATPGGDTTIAPTSSQDTIVGNTGIGTLDIDGGNLIGDRYGFLGRYKGSDGRATVRGPGSQWANNSMLYVGNSGIGMLSIEAGGQVSDTSGLIGVNGSSTGMVIVTGPGSQWTNSSTLYVGNSGMGTLSIEAGGQVSNTWGYLGHNADSTGTATVSGAGSTWTNSGDLYVGNFGSGRLTVMDGGLVTARTLFASSSDLYGNGTIAANGGILDAELVFDSLHGTTLAFGSGGALNLALNGTAYLGVGYKGSGSLSIADGMTVASTSGYLGYQTGSSGTVTVSGPGSKWTNSGFTVGQQGSGTLLIAAGGQVSSSYAGILGEYAGATGAATVSGAGSKWTTSSDLYVGSSGSGTLTIDAGGQVSNSNGYVGFQAGSSGTATVSGAGSIWTNSRDLRVRHGAMLTVANGGLVTSKTLYASLSDLYGNGTIRVSAGAVLDADLVFDSTHGTTQTLAFGSGGTLNLTFDGTSAVGVGYKDSGSLRIADGAAVTSAEGYLGYLAGSSGAATVSGAGSKWINSSRLDVGHFGNGMLTVTDGGLVTTQTLYASLSDLQGNGTITVSAGAVLDADLVFDSTHGATQTLAFGSGGTLNVTFSATGVLGAGHKDSGSLRIADGVVVTSRDGNLGYSAGSSGTATVSGTGSKWISNNDLEVGYSGSGALIIEAGGQVNSRVGLLGLGTGSSGTARVSGPGSKWTNEYLYVGNNGSGTLRVEAGGQASNSGGCLGYNAGSNGLVTVSGAGSTWTNSIDLSVGDRGRGTMIIDAGGQVSNTSGYLGYSAGSSGTATVSGSGSKWINSSELRIGVYGGGMLTINAGGQVSNTSGYLGRYPGSTGTAQVSGAESKWTNSSTLHVGNDGSGTLMIEAGGQVSSSGGVIGSNTGSDGTATVRGAGSSWTTTSVYIGDSGSGTLMIEAGGQVSSSSGVIGSNTGSNGTATVGGAGSRWTNSNTLYVGNSGHGAMAIEAGGQVSSSSGYLGYNPDSAGTVAVSGAGSTWTNSGSLYVGNSGSGRLTVSDGGLVTAKTLYASLGDLHGNGTITANGSVLDADLVFDSTHGTTQMLAFGAGGTLNLTISETSAMGVGYRGSGSVSITDSIALASSYGYLGYTAGSVGTAMVSGAGSTWTTTSDMRVGLNGSGTLTIEGGGQVSNSYGYLGQYPGSAGTATVRGAGSTWTNKSRLAIGLGGSGTLTVSDGGLVTAYTLYASPGDLHGDGTITVHGGAVLDADLVFDSAHGKTQTLAFGDGGTLNLTVNGGDFGVGYKGVGSVRIVDGVRLASYASHLGYSAGSSGTATISGAGSAWTSNGSFFVGNSGSGKLAIEAGGQMTSGVSNLGYYAGSTGTVTVNGANSRWTCGSLTVGRGGQGTMDIEAGAQVSSNGGEVGYSAGSTGAVVVSGVGSKWTSSNLTIGRGGAGTLTIEGGGQVSGTDSYIASGFDSTSMVTVSGAGSTWTSSGKLHIGFNGRGTLTVEAGGQVVNGTGFLGYGSPDSFATVREVGSKWINLGPLYIGIMGRGTLMIECGGEVRSDSGFLGQATTAGSGAATVRGAGSRWINRGELRVGDTSSGTLVIEDGGLVSSGSGALRGLSGTVTVRGEGSTWINNSHLNVGDSGRGTVSVADGGKVTAATLSINGQSTVRLHVSGDDMLVLGDASWAGRVSNGGTVGVYADAFLPAGVYRPISEYAGRTMSWTGSGSYKAVGGAWSDTAKTFTVVEPTVLAAGASDVVSSGERMLFTDSATGERVGASFGTVTGSASFSAMPVGEAEQTALAGLLGPGKMVLGAWDFATSLSGSEAMLSFDVGRWVTDLSVWQLSSGAWSLYAPGLMTHDAKGIASFTVSSFGGYAVSGVELPQWRGDAIMPGLWTMSGNWSVGAEPGKGGQAVFAQAGVNKSVDLGGGTCTAGMVRLASGEGYSIGNGILAIDNAGRSGGGIRVEGSGNGGHVISAAVRIVDDASIVIDSGSLSLSGGVEIVEGKTLGVAKAGAGALQISAITGGTGTLSLGAGTVTKLGGDSSVGELLMDESARLDLSAAELVVASGSLEEINRLVASGRAGGSWNGAGIMSSALAGEGANRTLAVLAEGDGVKVMQTWAGDLTGDGVVDGADYLALDRGFLADPGTLLYAQGNIDYSLDGITGDDFFQLDRAFLGQSAASSGAGEFGAVSATVPEPGTLTLLALAGSMLLARRRTR